VLDELETVMMLAMAFFIPLLIVMILLGELAR
jgi:hypothetical protein